jgi:nucleotide-binding universal stress UspA family protein
MGHIHNILVAVDGSPSSLAGLAEGITLAEELGAHVEVLHVDKTSTETVPIATEAKTAQLRAQHEMEDAIAKAKERLGDRLARRDLVGDPVRTILETAAEIPAELIVIGTHGRVGRLHELAGSVAATLVRSAPCPVLTVRRPDGEEESFGERIHGRAPLASQVRPPR